MDNFLNNLNEFGKRDKSIEYVIIKENIDQVFQNSQKRTYKKNWPSEDWSNAFTSYPNINWNGFFFAFWNKVS